MSSKQQIVCALCLLALALQVTAVSTEYWSEKTASYNGMNGDVHSGLWQLCIEGSGSYGGVSASFDGCIHSPPDTSVLPKFPKNSLHAVRAFAIMGIVLVFLGSLGMMYMPAYRKSELAMLIAGGISSLIANIIWASDLLKIDTLKLRPGYSFYMNLLGGISALASAMVVYKYK